jgi:lipopolysaccharide export LptBFGC system permease protein LptF
MATVEGRVIGRCARHFVAVFWRQVAITLLAAVGLVVGLELAFGSDDGPIVASLAERLADVAPSLPAPLAFIAVMGTLARFHREGSLPSLAAAGIPLRRAGLWILIGALPLAVLAQLFDAFPLSSRARTDAPSRTVALAQGALFTREGPASARLKDGAVLSLADERLYLGSAQRPPPGSPESQVRLRVRERWDLTRAEGFAERLAAPELWVGQSLPAPRSLVFGTRAASPELATLQRWLASEPARADLRFARDVRLRSGLRVLAMVLIALAVWLRPTQRANLARGAIASLAVVAYLVVEGAVGSLGAVGTIEPSAAAFGPVAAVAAAALARSWWCDRPVS